MNAREALKSLCQNCYLNNDNCACHFHAEANVLNKTKDPETFYCNEHKQLETALTDLERLQERDKAKKVISLLIVKVCPSCSHTVGFVYQENFCDHCGQRLDWSE